MNMFSSKTATFDRLLDKATSKLLLDPDWDSTMQICDSIRQGDVQPSYALGAIRKKIENENPHVSKYALQVLESMVKNCGSIVHAEVATRDYMDFLKEQAKKRQDPVKGKIVELVQVWSHAFRKEESYKVVQETFSSMKSEGFAFPTLKESDAMFVAEKAPEWRDGELCHRCRAAFTTFNRKHHCRACGQVFCQKCSAKTSIIPKYGIEKEVRVCDACYDQIMKPLSSALKKDELPAEYINSPLSKQSQLPPNRTEAEIQEEEELQLALALSQSEAEAKEKQRAKQNIGYSLNSTTENLYSQSMKTATPAAPQVIDTSDMGPELAHYLNRNYWQQKSFEMKNTSMTQPSAPSVSSSLSSSGTVSTKNSPLPVKNEVDENQQPLENGSSSDEEREQFLKALSSSIEIFVNRMKSNSQRGRSIANDSSVQTLFMTLTAMHPTLMKYMQQQEESRARYESLQDKLAQLKDARDALDVLREEHKEKRRRQQEEMERLRQIQLAQKLEVLRQQKQVYLEYQRQMALQRMQEQEMEMRKRLEMQKQEQQMKAMQYGYPQAFSQTLPSGPYPAQPQAYAPVNQIQIPPTQQATYSVYAPGLGVAQQLSTSAHPANQPHPGLGLSPQHQPHIYQQQPAYQTLPTGIPQQGVPPSTMAGVNTYMGYPPQLINNSVMMSAYQPGGAPVTVDQQVPQQVPPQSHQQNISLPSTGASYMGGYYAPGHMTSQMPAQPPTSAEAELINFD